MLECRLTHARVVDNLKFRPVHGGAARPVLPEGDSRCSVSFDFAPEWGQSLGDGVCSNFDEPSFIVILHALQKATSSPSIRVEPGNVRQNLNFSEHKVKPTFCDSSPRTPCSPGYAYVA